VVRMWHEPRDHYQALGSFCRMRYRRKWKATTSAVETVSIVLDCTTAEAHTFLAGPIIFRRLEERSANASLLLAWTRICNLTRHRAYLIELRQFDEAIPWLQQAATASVTRRDFPHTIWPSVPGERDVHGSNREF